MCGILGHISFSKDQNYQTQFNDALEMLNHRGPDHTGIRNFELKNVIKRPQMDFTLLELIEGTNEISINLSILCGYSLYFYLMINNQIAYEKNMMAFLIFLGIGIISYLIM